MIKQRGLKSLALLSLTAFLANISLNTLLPSYSSTSPDDIHNSITAAVNSYDEILTTSRRLTLRSPSDTRLSQIRAHHVQLLLSRGLDPKSARFKELLRERMRRVNAVREERGGERKILRGLKIGEEIWRGTPFVSLGAEEQKTRNLDTIQLEPLHVCDRPTNVGALSKFALLPELTTCPGRRREGSSLQETMDVNATADITSSDPEEEEESTAITATTEEDPTKESMLLLSGTNTFGRTGNNLIEFLHALQVARDKDLILGIMTGSWAMQVLMGMFMAIEGEGWEEKWEDAFCAKIIKSEDELEEYNVLTMTTKELFGYTSPSPYDEYVASTQYSIRALFQNYNTGKGTSIRRNQKAGDMCSGIDALFGPDKSRAIYSVIHSRHLEGAPGLRLLSKVCRHAKCDATAALEMRPDYIKSILGPLGMLQHPIVLITDGQDFSVIQRLMADEEIGSMLRVVPEESSWIGGDLTLGIMSNVFIGNPASTFSTFIAKSRLSLGFGQNYLFRRKTAEGVWVTSCGDGCVFDKRVMDVMS